MRQPFRLLVTGSRTWADELAIEHALAQILDRHPEGVLLLHGNCSCGADAIAAACAARTETVQDLWIDEIADVIHRRIPRAAGIAAMAVSGDLDHVKVDIHARRPGLAHGHGHAEFDRLRAELAELTGKPVQLNILEARPEKGRKEIQLGPQMTPGGTSGL